MAESSVFENLYTEELYRLPPSTLVLIDRPWSDVTEEERTLLSKILGSVKLSLSAVKILQRDHADVNDLGTLNSRKIISFGVDVNPVQKRYEYVPIDGVHVIVSDSLADLDDTRKKQLWIALRQMFGM